MTSLPVRYSKVMDVLIEMTPGAGWLARENDRVVFLPGEESVETAHDVIEPLLVAKSTDESFETLQSWIHRETPLPPMILVSLESSVRFLSHGIDELSMLERPDDDPRPVEVAA